MRVRIWTIKPMIAVTDLILLSLSSFRLSLRFFTIITSSLYINYITILYKYKAYICNKSIHLIGLFSYTLKESRWVRCHEINRETKALCRLLYRDR
jgi:hypothetical protein